MKREKCANCGGLLVPQKITYEKKMGDQRALFEQVPALVCTSCDEVWLDATVVRKMEKILQEGNKPTRWTKIPTWSLAKAA